ncbi:hypothetical protein BT63DRAFT_463781 [Microthyrium microscopicum]|uniref:CFEM domain-containing protein n=1 Tax=Microthyrium microscopicum TaxID=703497 RepID=A0A6A6U0C9_9PEZI|nr:hypothetical protein BT63DRAFT_463781 [Microthyrium microscopicum]
MKVTFVSILAVLATTVIAQDDTMLKVAGFPDCAFACIKKAASKAGCAPTDAKCACTPEVQDRVTRCLTKADSVCQPSDLSKMKEVSVNLCASQGITINPDAAPTATKRKAATSSAPGASKTTGGAASTAKSTSTTAKSGFAAATQAPLAVAALMGAAAVMVL